MSPDPLPSRQSARIKPRPLLEISLDVAVLTVAVLLFAPPGARGWMGLFVAFFIGGLAANGHYTTRFTAPALAELRSALATSAVAMMGAVSLHVLLGANVELGRRTATFWLAAVAAMVVVRGLLVVVDTRRRRDGKGMHRVLIVGAGEVGRLAARRLVERPDVGLQPVGFLDSDPLDGDGDEGELQVLGSCRDLERVVAEQAVDMVLVGFCTAPHPVLLDAVHRCWELGVEVLVVPRLFEVEGTRTEVRRVGGLPFIALHPTTGGAALRVKYGCDRVLAALALLALAPFLAVAALLIKLTTHGPVLYRASRVGENGRTFEMLKLRTMTGSPATRGEADTDWADRVLRASTARWAALEPVPSSSAGADARTAIGRFLRRTAIDELPQLWNVVRGEMALVGPRPERVHFSELFSSAIYRYDERYRVRPGITGWAQIHGLRGKTSLRDRVEWDNFYVENWSPWFDLKILALTPVALLRSSEA